MSNLFRLWMPPIRVSRRMSKGALKRVSMLLKLSRLWKPPAIFCDSGLRYVALDNLVTLQPLVSKRVSNGANDRNDNNLECDI
eukprot:1161410-Pelagomonas_calceolata.AAC.6